MSKLWLVPTPIGNLKDFTYRAVEILQNTDLILAEDTRQAKKLLNHYNIPTQIESHHKFNEHKNVETICSRILSGLRVALISDAGTPGISDPGFLLVRTCIRKGIEIESLPGPSAILPALINSGLPCDRFCFEGFLPSRKGRNKRLSALQKEDRTMIFFESPHRLVRTLDDLISCFGPDRYASVSREMTKIFEENIRGTLKYLSDHYKNNQPKGEIVLVVSGNRSQKEQDDSAFINFR